MRKYMAFNKKNCFEMNVCLFSMYYINPFILKRNKHVIASVDLAMYFFVVMIELPSPPLFKKHGH